MSQPVKKTAPDEKLPPFRSATIRSWNGRHLTVVFNKDLNCFERDVILLKIGNVETYVTRDDLAEVLINGYNETKEYREEMVREEKALRSIKAGL